MRQTSRWSSNHNHATQQEDAMDIDEQILNDVASLRASGWQASAMQPFDEAKPSAAPVQTFIVLDSNVLISFLPLVRELLATIPRQARKMALCLPNVVVAELNFLKERNANPNTRALAQEANVWLLAAVRSRNGFLRGQQKHEGLEQLERDRAHHLRRVNDDQIIDYCQYLLNTAREENGVVCLLSNDQNCCLKAELEGIITISPKPGSNAGGIVSTIAQKAVASVNPGGASSSSNFSNQAVPSNAISYGPSTARNIQPVYVGSSVEGFMDLDDHEQVVSPSISHPVSQLHSQLIDHLSEILPHLAYDAALLEQSRRETGKSKPKPKPSALYTSIHAPKGGAETEYGARAFIMPTQEEVQSWKPLDCIHFVLEFPPSTDATPTTQTRNRRPPAISKLKLFLLPYGTPGGRRGKDWSVGDWKAALEELDQVATFCGWQSVHHSAEVCRSQLSQSGLQV